MKHDEAYIAGFENGFEGWFVYNGSWEVGTPTAGPVGAYSGSDCAGTVLAGNYPSDASSYLMSPTIVLPTIEADEELVLRFWHWFAFGGYDYGIVQICEETSPGVWSSWNSLASYSSSGGGVWSYPLVDLSAYAGKKVRIAYYLSNSGNYGYVGLGWYIDDIAIQIR